MKKTILSALFLLVISTLSAQKVFYVNGNSGNDSNSGLRWSSAFQNLQQAIDTAEAGDTINVSAGKYLPAKKITDKYGGNTYPETLTGDRHKTFLFNKNLKVFGGYPANATDLTTLADRNWTDNETILSGDFNNDDGADFTNMDENALHIIVMKDVTRDMVLDGFVITNGGSSDSATVYYNGAPIQYSCGGGIYAISNTESSPTLANLIFKNNKVSANGAAFYNYSNGKSAPELLNVQMLHNMSGERGGAFYIDGNDTGPDIINSIFAGNSTPAQGGAILCVGNNVQPRLYGVLLSGNRAKEGGGAYIIALGGDVSPDIINCTISGNIAGNDGFGGGIVINAGVGEANPAFRNTVIWGNDGGQYPDFYVHGSTGTNPDYEGNLIEGEELGGTNLSGATIPLFVSSVDAKTAPTVAGNYRLQENSPLIDKGSQIYFTDIPNVDLDGNPRVYNTGIDIGAYEYQGTSGNEVVNSGHSIWSSGKTLHVSVQSGHSTLKIHSLSGQLIRQVNNLSIGYHEFILSDGLYIVTLNGKEYYKISIR